MFQLFPRRAVWWRALPLAALLAALLLASAPLAGAAPAQAPQSVHVFVPNFVPRIVSAQSAQPAPVALPQRTAGTYSCISTEWITLYGGVHGFDWGLGWSDQMQAGLLLRVAATDHSIYCGGIVALAWDTLLTGCQEFGGEASINAAWNTGASEWGFIYHCTHTLYAFQGPQWNPTCLSGSAIYVDNVDGQNDNVYYGPWYC